MNLEQLATQAQIAFNWFKSIDDPALVERFQNLQVQLDTKGLEYSMAAMQKYLDNEKLQATNQYRDDVVNQLRRMFQDSILTINEVLTNGTGYKICHKHGYYQVSYDTVVNYHDNAVDCAVYIYNRFVASLHA